MNKCVNEVLGWTNRFTLAKVFFFVYHDILSKLYLNIVSAKMNVYISDIDKNQISCIPSFDSKAQK